MKINHLRSQIVIHCAGCRRDGSGVNDAPFCVTIANVKEVQNIHEYDALVLGSAIRNGAMLPVITN
jgi:hypothetical protein